MNIHFNPMIIQDTCCLSLSFFFLIYPVYAATMQICYRRSRDKEKSKSFGIEINLQDNLLFPKWVSFFRALSAYDF